MTSEEQVEDRVKEEPHREPILSGGVESQASEGPPCIKKRKYQKYHTWNDAENYAYITYLSNYKWSFENESTRKKYQVFIHMAKFIRNRDHKQIKSHHQKMLLKYGDIDQAVEGITQQTRQLIVNRPDLMDKILSINSAFENFYQSQKRFQSEKDQPIKRQQKKKSEAPPPLSIEVDSLSYSIKNQEEELPYIVYHPREDLGENNRDQNICRSGVKAEMSD